MSCEVSARVRSSPSLLHHGGGGGGCGGGGAAAAGGGGGIMVALGSHHRSHAPSPYSSLLAAASSPPPPLSSSTHPASPSCKTPTPTASLASAAPPLGEVTGEEMGHLFDHIEDLLDFPGDDDDVFGMAQAEPLLLLLPPVPVPVGDEILGGGEGEKKAEAAFGMEEDKLVPCDELDIEQLEWMSKFIEDSDSFSLVLPAAAGGGGADTSVGGRCCFRTSSPVSVLEENTDGGGGVSSDSYTTAASSSSSSTSASSSIGGEKEGRAMPPPPPPPPTLIPLEQPEVPVVSGRTRSKRARPATFSPHPLVVVTCLPPLAATAAPATSDPESFGESSPPPPTPPLNKKNKNKNPYPDKLESALPPPPPPAAAGARKCAHCQIQKTPQWRAGPTGLKTLCNACGVRYKSGRLFPEYRPAASPTFVPSVHSNSHKKVVEMRSKATHTAAGADGCDLLDYLRRRRH